MGDSVTTPAGSDRTLVQRDDRQVTDPAVVHRILDSARVAHVAFCDDEGQPYCLPVAFARDGDRVLLHGSTGSRLFRALASGVRACLTVTVVDGLVLARSAFNSSMNYRSVMALGSCEALDGEAKERALDVVTERLLPGRRQHLRAMSRKEIAATLVLAMPLSECSAKIRSGDPSDDAEDVGLPIWAGVLPIREVVDAPVDASDLPDGVEVPEHVRDLSR